MSISISLRPNGDGANGDGLSAFTLLAAASGVRGTAMGLRADIFESDKVEAMLDDGLERAITVEEGKQYYPGLHFSRIRIREWVRIRVNLREFAGMGGDTFATSRDAVRIVCE